MSMLRWLESSFVAPRPCSDLDPIQRRRERTDRTEETWVGRCRRMNRMLLRAFAVWLLQLVVIVVLGGLRDTFLEPIVGEHRAHQIGTVLASLAVLGVICAFLSWIGAASRAQALGLGAFWLLLALVFEFGVFHFIVGVPWSRLVEDYDLAHGNLLLLLWCTVLFGPVACFVVRDGNGLGRGGLDT